MTSIAQVPSRISISAEKTEKAERWHRVRLAAAAAGCALGMAWVAYFGSAYYLLSAAERPFSPKHHLLRPSGMIGINLGVAGVAMFAIIFLYPLRKRISWLARRGNSQHWLDFHIVLGLTAPVLIAFHASFKFHGIAGMAFWLMLSVAISGIVGRYLYAQVPRSINSAEATLRDLDEQTQSYSDELATQKIIPADPMRAALHVPSPEQVQAMSLPFAVGEMIALDLMRPWRIARLRRAALHGTEKLFSLGGFLPSSHPELEQVIRAARQRSSLAKRVVFLSRAQQGLHLWHVVHRPFSYSFLVLAVVHIGVVIGLGFI
ncbi:MAG TPA: hypothetical protein VF786_07590 [Terriglobales bacterium]